MNRGSYSLEPVRRIQSIGDEVMYLRGRRLLCFIIPDILKRKKIVAKEITCFC
jgi:hypothetical protein